MQHIKVENLQKLAKELDKRLNPKGKREMGYAFLMFPLGTPGISNYVSNANRLDMIIFIEQLLERLKTGKANQRKARFNNEQATAIVEFIKSLSKEDRKKLVENAEDLERLGM